MSLLLWSLAWVSFSVLVSLLVLMETKRNDQSVCLCCGRVIDGPGICESCAAEAESVDQVVQARHVIPDYAVIEPGDLQ